MKAFIPATILALAGATSACTFIFDSYPLEDAETYVEFIITSDDEAYGPDGFDAIGSDDPYQSVYPLKEFTGENLCQSTRPSYGHTYEICAEGGMGDDGRVAGDVTVQRDGGEKVSIKDDGEVEENDDQVTYWRGGIECPRGPSTPTPTPSL